METLTIPVNGMTCGGCVSSVQRALGKLDGVADAVARLEPGEVAVRFDPARVEPPELVSAIEAAGFDVPGSWSPPGEVA